VNVFVNVFPLSNIYTYGIYIYYIYKQVQKSAEHYTEAAQDEIALLKCIKSQCSSSAADPHVVMLEVGVDRERKIYFEIYIHPQNKTSVDMYVEYRIQTL
jgi:hypothetical protein